MADAKTNLNPARLGTWIVFGAVPPILFGLLALWYQNASALDASTRWIEHTLDVQREIGELFANVLDLESSTRGLVLSGADGYLTRFELARAEVPGRLERLAQLTHDNPSQQERLARMEALVRGLGEDDALLVALARERGLDAARAAFSEGDPKKQLPTLRSLVTEMLQEQQQLFLDRSDEARASSRRSVRIGAGLAIFLLIAVAGYYALIRLEMQRRQRGLEELRQTNQFLDTLVEGIPHMVFVKDAKELAFTRMNRAGEKLLGVKREELLGKTDLDFFPETEALFFQEKDREALRTGAEIDIAEEPIQTTNGIRWLHTKKVPLTSQDGTPLFLLGISEDITERKQDADRLRRAKEAAEATSSELEAFSYSISHDLRSPLRSIDGFSQALLEDYVDKLDATGQDYFRRVRAAAQRMGELIDDLLALSRVSRGELDHRPVDLSRLATEVGGALAAAQPQRQVTFSVAPGLTALGDDRLLRIAFENLLGNAWKFTSKKPQAKIEVGFLAGGEEGCFFVRDDGDGFDMAYSKKLFGPFQRLHSAGEFEGTGIGLATVQRIIRRHGGRIWAKGTRGEGATFFFTLPARG